MGKRAAIAAAAAAPAKAAKTTKTAVVEQASPVEDLFLKECEPLLDFLATAEGTGGEESRMMLRVGAPLALKTLPEDRHKYQTAVIGSIVKLIAKTRCSRAAHVETAQASCAALEAEEATATEGLKEIQAAVAEKSERSQEKVVACKTATEVLSAARQAFQAEKAAASSLAAQLGTMETEKKAHEAARTELWEPLISNAIEGSAWRIRDKKIVEVQKLLAQAGAPGSLVASAGVALKEKADKRGVFALAALEHGDAALTARVEKLGSTMGTADTETAEKHRQVEAAEAAVEQAQAAQQEAKAAQQEASAALAAEQHGERARQQELKQFAPRRKHLAAELEAVKNACDDAVKLAAKFESLEAGPGCSKPETVLADAGVEAADEAPLTAVAAGF